MRTTIRLDEALLRRAKSMAAASGRSLNDFIADAVRAAVAPRTTRGAAAPTIPVFKGGTLLPGVDLDDSAGLLDLMDRPAPAESRARRAAEERPRRTR
jgi:hypothetical protein